jgi:hypothetical protein
VDRCAVTMPATVRNALIGRTEDCPLNKLKRHCSKFLVLENLGKEVLSMQDLADANPDVLGAMLLLQCKRCQEIQTF